MTKKTKKCLTDESMENVSGGSGKGIAPHDLGLDVNIPNIGKTGGPGSMHVPENARKLAKEFAEKFKK